MSKLLGLLFKEWRFKQHLTLRQCEKLTGMSNAFLSQFERGHCDIGLDKAVTIFVCMMATKADE